MNLPAVPEITAAQLRDMLTQQQDVLVLDVREPFEWTRAYLRHPLVSPLPLSELSARGLEALPEPALDKQKPLVILCHHGERSRMVTAWLRAQGWQQAVNLAGGIDAYARQVDVRVGIY